MSVEEKNGNMAPESPGSCLHEPENGIYTMMVREDTNHGLIVDTHHGTVLPLSYFIRNIGPPI